MDKQEEIREGIKRVIGDYFPLEHINCDASCTTKYMEEENLEQSAQEIMGYLHSQGVVVRVDKVLYDIGIEYYNENVAKMLKAGYVTVEPLVEE